MTFLTRRHRDTENGRGEDMTLVAFLGVGVYPFRTPQRQIQGFLHG
jgi:hypothetical protein